MDLNRIIKEESLEILGFFIPHVVSISLALEILELVILQFILECVSLSGEN